jgi:hypothetical protein
MVFLMAGVSYTSHKTVRLNILMEDGWEVKLQAQVQSSFGIMTNLLEL